jgi:rfaE bifunctional protein kinase chain/domain
MMSLQGCCDISQSMSRALSLIQQRLPQLISSIRGRRILIVGDVGLDEYVIGDVRRISPEAPVPIVEVQSQDQRLGLAANVAQNVASLGGVPVLLSVVGRDGAREELVRLLEMRKVDTKHLIIEEARPTTRKLRVMAGHHHIVRVDYELKRFLQPEIERALLDRAAELIGDSDAMVLQDYAKGVLSEVGIQSLIKLAHQRGKKVLLDPNPRTPPHYYRGVDLLTPNRDEAVALSGLDADELRQSDDFILRVGRAVRDRLQAERVVLTRGPEGMSLFDGDKVTHLPTYARQVFDVTGAGDTVIAALSLAWASGADLEASCVLANYAAGVVVGKIGCVPCEIADLEAYIARHSNAGA